MPYFVVWRGIQGLQTMVQENKFAGSFDIYRHHDTTTASSQVLRSWSLVFDDDSLVFDCGIHAAKPDVDHSGTVARNSTEGKLNFALQPTLI